MVFRELKNGNLIFFHILALFALITLKPPEI